MLLGTCKYVKKNSFPFPKFLGTSFLFKKTLNVFLVSVYFIVIFLCLFLHCLVLLGGGGGVCVCVRVYYRFIYNVSQAISSNQKSTRLSVSVKRADLFVVKIIAKIKF